ncbi:MAG: alpha/beta fold hydrolase [Ignavibacteriaceae bacterium]
MCYFVLDYAINNYLAYSPIRPTRVLIGDLTPSKYGLKYKDFNITVEDTIILRGWFVFSDSTKPKGTIFLLHGIGSNKAAMLANAKSLVAAGFNCVLYDSRANGESEGLNCTFGFYEKKDLSSFIDSVSILFPGSEPYGALGHSLGAAIVIQSMKNDKRIKCAVAQSPFADLRNTIYDYSERMYSIRINWIVEKILERSEEIANFEVDKVNPSLDAEFIDQPVMIVHGLEDERISYKYGKEIYNNLKSLNKNWYPIPGGNHNNLSQIGGSKLDSSIIKYFAEYLKK